MLNLTWNFRLFFHQFSKKQINSDWDERWSSLRVLEQPEEDVGEKDTCLQSPGWPWVLHSHAWYSACSHVFAPLGLVIFYSMSALASLLTAIQVTFYSRSIGEMMDCSFQHISKLKLCMRGLYIYHLWFGWSPVIYLFLLFFCSDFSAETRTTSIQSWPSGKTNYSNNPKIKESIPNCSFDKR